MATVGIVAGETSGDLHAGNLVRALRRLEPEARVWAVGGDTLRRAGAEIVFPVEELGGMGLLEAAGTIPAVLRARSVVLQRFRVDPPDLFLPVDFGGLNLRLARRARRAGIPVVYYIPPKIWAWGPWRARALRRSTDEALVVLPFEEGFLRSAGIPATYVGSPVRDHLGPPGHEAEPDVIGLLPGSRSGEVRRIWPELLDAAELLARKRRLRVLVARAPGVKPEWLADPLRGRDLQVEMVEGDAQQVMERARVCLVASGTATLECALIGTPMVISYRLNPITHLVGRLLVRVPFIGLPNLVAGRKIVPEFIQAAPGALAAAALPLLEDGPERREMLAGLAEVRHCLGGRDASEGAAKRVLRRLRAGAASPAGRSS